MSVMLRSAVRQHLAAAASAPAGHPARPCGIRQLHLSAALLRIPPYHRKRYKRTLVPPYHKVAFADEDTARVPLLPLDGSLQTTRRTPEEELRTAMLAKRSLQGKLHVLSETEPNMWYRRMDLPLAHPCALPLAQAICQTTIENRLFGEDPYGSSAGATAANPAIGGSSLASTSTSTPAFPSGSGAASRLPSESRAAIVSSVVSAVRALESQHRWPEPPGPRATSRMQQRRICTVMETLLLGCARAGALQSPEDLQAEDSPFVQMIARYFGLHPSASKRLLLPDLASMRTNRFLIRAPLAWQLRSRCPLRPLAPPIGVRRPPDWPYNPDLLGLEPELDHWRFDESRRYTSEIKGKPPIQIVPGAHTSDDQWGPGDPCEFGLVLAINGDDNRGTDQPPPVDFLRPENWPALTCDALLRLYASTAAQAFNRGFNWVTDLRLGDRPFVTQAATFVGDSLKLSAYQLGTVAGGGRDDDATAASQSLRINNQMWTQPEPLPLWQRDPQTGRVTDVNSEQLLRLADLLCAPRCTHEEAAESRPFLDGEAPCSRRLWLGSEFVYKAPEPAPFPARKSPQSYNHMYLLDPVKPSKLYSILQAHPGFARLPEAVEARAARWRLDFERRKQGRRKVVRKPMLISDTFP